MHKINYSDDIDLSKISAVVVLIKVKYLQKQYYCKSKTGLNAEELQLLNIKRGSYKARVASYGFPSKVTSCYIPAINNKAPESLTLHITKANRIAIHIDGKSRDSQLNTELSLRSDN